MREAVDELIIEMRLFVADMVLVLSQELGRVADRLDRLHSRLDPNLKAEWKNDCLGPEWKEQDQ